jgi:tetratricopeptide (TPR) repeat protein
MNSRALFCCLLAWLTAMGGIASAKPGAIFHEASQAYAGGDYEKAAALLAEQSARRVAPGLLHNLGNAHYKLDQTGRAILAWERARALDPGARNTAANLQFARGEAGLEAPQFAWHESYSMLLSADAWLLAATATFWTGAVLLALPPLLRRRRRAWSQAAAVVALGVFLLTLPALAGIASRQRLGVVIVPEPSLRLTPTAEGEPLGKLAEGELARIEKTRGSYLYLRATNDRAGWVKTEEFERIWP